MIVMSVVYSKSSSAMASLVNTCSLTSVPVSFCVVNLSESFYVWNFKTLDVNPVALCARYSFHQTVGNCSSNVPGKLCK